MLCKSQNCSKEDSFHLVEDAGVKGLAAAALLLAPGAVAVQEPGAADFVTIGSILLHIVGKQSMKEPLGLSYRRARCLAGLRPEEVPATASPCPS